jgi:hypothetical protein
MDRALDRQNLRAGQGVLISEDHDIREAFIIAKERMKMENKIERITYWQITAQLRGQKTISRKFQNWVRTLSHSRG